MRLFVSSLSNSGSAPEPQIIQFRSLNYNIWTGFGNATKSAAIYANIDRIDADIITICEIDESGFDAEMAGGLNDRGYLYGIHNQGTYNIYDTAFCSKYEITYSERVNNPALKFVDLYVELDIKGKKIGVFSHHANVYCPTSGCGFEEETPEPAVWNKEIENKFIVDFLEAKKLSSPDISGFIIQGDFNADGTGRQATVGQYTEAVTVSGAKPDPGFMYPMQVNLHPQTQLLRYNGVMDFDISPDIEGRLASCPNPNPNSGWGVPEIRIDYIMNTDDIIKLGAEVLYSESDAATGGLQKYGEPLPTGTSYDASDHLPVFGDYKIL